MTTPPPPAQEAIFDLLDRRGPGRTICLSEAARAMAGPHGDWRAQMDEIHSAADALNASGQIKFSWKGEEIDQRRGAYRIARR